MSNLVEVTTFIRGKESFVRPENFNGIIKGRYLEGSLLLRIGDKVLLDPEIWDDLGSIWYFLSDAIDKLINNEDYSFSYPDQPLHIDIKALGDQATVIVSIPRHESRIEASTGRKELASALFAAAYSFSSIMLAKTSGINNRTCKAVLNRLESMKKSIVIDWPN